MKIKNNYQYTITDRLGTVSVIPLGEYDFVIEFSKENEGKRFYKQEMPSKIVFIGDIYTRLLKIERSIYRCDFIAITVDRNCNGVFVPWFSGRFTLNDGDWDLSGCKVTIKLDDVNVLACLEDNKTQEINIFNFVGVRRTVALYDPRIQIEKITKTRIGNTGSPTVEDGCNAYAWDDDGTRYWQFGWFPYLHSSYSLNEGGNPYNEQCTVTTSYARQVLNLSCLDDEPGGDWIKISDCREDPTSTPEFPRFIGPVYARFASVYDCKYTYPDSTWYTFYSMECKVIGDEGVTASIDNGVPLETILKGFLQTDCPDLTLRSDFFQINPFNPSSTNYVTGKRSKTRYITVFQKSDVKRPSVANNATIAKYTFEKILNALVTMFNVRYRVVGSDFVIEHVSRFQPGIGMNLTLPKYAAYKLDTLKKYTYDNSAKPAREEFSFMEAIGADFVGTPIVYNSGCTAKGGRDNIKKYQAENITTDVEYVLGNSASDSKNVSDEGFVFMATDLYNPPGGAPPIYYVISEESILATGSALNNSLAWAQLQRDYHKYDRPIRYGMMNNVNTRFLSVIPTKKGESITIPLCCDDNFNPDQLIVTPLGTGEIEKATYSFKSQTLKLDLLYPDDDNLTSIQPPVVKNDVVSMYKNQSVDIDVTANDSDPDGTISRVEILLPPNNGTAVVIDKKIRYTPNTDYVGQESIVYRVYDDWSEPSNNALVSITINATNMGPIAGDTTFDVPMNTTLNVPAPGALRNSSDDVGFTLVGYQNPTAQGGSVVLNANGSFVYNPAASFTGLDTFTYTVEDETGLSSTGTATITVKNPNFPVAVSDVYSTKLNTELVVNSVNGVLANDYGPGPLSTVGITKQTSAGGSVTINGDGGFSYTPLAGFTGKDYFTYTVTNSSGSAQGSVEISVLPPIFIKLSLTDYKYNNIIEFCNGAASIVGRTNTSDVVLNFYTSSNGTTPINVTGMGLIVNVLISTSYPDGSSSSYSEYFEVSGESEKIIEDFIQLYSYQGCNNPETDSTYYTIQLVAGNYTII